MFHDKDLTGAVPLVVDLDGTLTRADIAVESLLRCISGQRGTIAETLGMFGSGLAGLKARLAKTDPVDPAAQPFRPEVIDLIEQARAEGRPVILSSAAHQRQVDRIARHLGLFDHAVGTSKKDNNKGAQKLANLRDLIGKRPFDYVGDSAADRAIWKEARTAYTVGVSTGCANEQRLAPAQRNSLRSIAKAARPHQWAKNLLVFVPLVTAGLIADADAILRTIVAFICLSVLASGTYVLNDLLDIDSDRAHATKHKRPLAAGTLSIPFAIILAFAAITGGLGIMAAVTGIGGLAALATYLVVTLTYSFRLKSAMIADVMALACLYTLRLVIGAAAIGVAVSFWLFLFSTFFFLSLGYVKRYVELTKSDAEDHRLIKGRGYIRADTDIVMVAGVSSGMVSLLVIVLFANAMMESGIYASPKLLWLLVLPLLYWINRIWMMARRGMVDGDPVAFAMKDRKSWVLFAMIGGIVTAARFLPLPI